MHLLKRNTNLIALPKLWLQKNEISNGEFMKLRVAKRNYNPKTVALYLFVCSLFNSAASNSDCRTRNWKKYWHKVTVRQFGTVWAHFRKILG